MAKEFQATTYPELLALHRMVLEAKFNASPNDEAIAGSPIVAKIADEIIEAIIDLETEKGDVNARTKWAKWKQIDPTRREWQTALEYAQRSHSSWINMSSEERKNFAVIILSPFQASDNLLDMFITQVDRYLEKERYV